MRGHICFSRICSWPPIVTQATADAANFAMASNEQMHENTAKAVAFHIIPVRSEEDVDATKLLFYDYTRWLDIDLNFQFFATEMANFPGKYAPPTGELLLARSGPGTPLGCVALRPLSDDICEMKRLFVKDSAKGLGIGKALVTAIIEAGRLLGYRRMRLDSLPQMTTALNLYRSLGFLDIEPYYNTPLPETLFLELILAPST